jgi:ABC-type dipeptide/oligopeptide/nickel transport system permease subunit
MANVKEIQRTERIEFLVSKEEKELIWKYAEAMGMKPSRIIRNSILMNCQSKMKMIDITAVKAYRKYLEITDPEYLKFLEEHD